MGRVTPSFRKLFLDQIEELRKNFRNCLLDLGHREAFDILLRDAWVPESHAMSNSNIPYILDSMNLLANIHNCMMIEKLSKKLNDLEERIKVLEEKLRELNDSI